jgi:hypothetical protein
MAFASPGAFAAEQSYKSILVLHSFGRDFKPWSDYGRVLRQELERQTRWHIELLDQSILSERLSSDNHDEAFVNYLESLYSNRQLDLIITIAAPAASFVQRRRAKFFPDRPVLFTAVNERRVQNSAMTKNDTVVASSNDHRVAVEGILRVLPATKTVMVVLGSSAQEKAVFELNQRELKPLESRVKLSWTNNLLTCLSRNC